MPIFQCQKVFILLLTATLIACGSNSPEQSGTESKFEGHWILTDYTLDDGTMKSVPDNIQNQGGVAISVSSAESMEVQSDLCDYYQISYLLDNDVLTTSDPVSPDGSCTGYYGDVDNAERSDLLRRTFFNSETLITISGDLLTVTTTQNEKLNFERSMM